MGYKKLSDVRTAGTYLIYEGHTYLSDYPANLRVDGLNYGVLKVDTAYQYIIQQMTAGDAAGRLHADAFCFINTSVPGEVFVSKWYRNATTTPPEVLPLALEPGLHSHDWPCTCSKTQDGEVIISARYEGDGVTDSIPNTCRVCCLIDGYRPASTLIRPARVRTSAGNLDCLPADALIYPDGGVSVQLPIAANYRIGILDFSFPAAPER